MNEPMTPVEEPSGPLSSASGTPRGTRLVELVAAVLALVVVFGAFVDHLLARTSHHATSTPAASQGAGQDGTW